MSVVNRRMLKEQLEQQAEVFGREQDDLKLVSSILVTCSALLRAAEKAMPQSISREEFDRIYAGYLGIVNKAQGFCKGQGPLFHENESSLLQTLLGELQALDEKKRALEQEITTTGNQVETEKKTVDGREDQLKKLKAQLELLTTKKQELTRKYEENQREIAQLEEQRDEFTRKIENFEQDMEKLIQEVDEAKNTYKELRAYYSELDRIREGFRQEGLVDVASFAEVTADMNKQGNELIAKYDSLLKNISQDIDALRDHINQKQNRGVVG